MTRGAYGKDAIYTRMALDSLKEWKALSATSGLPIFIPHGVLFFFQQATKPICTTASPRTARLACRPKRSTGRNGSAASR